MAPPPPERSGGGRKKESTSPDDLDTTTETGSTTPAPPAPHNSSGFWGRRRSSGGVDDERGKRGSNDLSDSLSTSSESEFSSSSDAETWDEDDEDDMFHALAEQAKEDVRRQLRELKAVYRSIRQRNMEIPERFRLTEEDLQQPREILHHIYEKIAVDCDEVYRVHEYESAETILLLEKIQKHFFDCVETPSFVVKDISHDIQVYTIRNKKPTLEFEEIVKRNKDLLDEEKRSHKEHVEQKEEKIEIEIDPIKRINAVDLIGEYESTIQNYGVETVHNIRHLEKRLEQKYDRECAWRDLMLKKIPKDYIPPEDKEILVQIRKQTGTYTLQKSDSFNDSHVTLAQRRQKIIDAKIAMREEVREFNRKVYEAREEKPKVLEECRRLEKEIRQLHVLLPDEFRKKLPPIYDIEFDEMPESFFLITVDDVEAEEQSMLTAAGLQNILEDIMEEYYGIPKPEKPFVEEDRVAFVPNLTHTGARAARQAKNVDLDFESVSSNRCRKVQFNPRNELERKKFDSEFYPRLYKQELLFEDLDSVIYYFRERIKYLHDRRVKLEIETKIRTIAVLNLINELDIAKDFKNQEKNIADILQAQRADNESAKAKMEELKETLVIANSGMRTCEESLMAVLKEVETTIGEKNRFKEFLWKVFRKKIPTAAELEAEQQEEEEAAAAAKVAEAGGGDAPAAQDKAKERLDIDTCPENCSRKVYDEVQALRLRRGEIEVEMIKNKQLGEEATAEYVTIEARYKKIQERLKELTEEDRVLNRRRQKKVNDLKLMVILKADQIQCLDVEELTDIGGELLEKLSQSFPGADNVIIFPKDGIPGLDACAKDLISKGSAEMEKLKRGTNMLTRLKQEFTRAQTEVASLKEKVKHEMEGKFGAEVDLDKVFADIINLERIEKEVEVKKVREEHAKERIMAQKQIEAREYTLTKRIKENSKLNMLKAVIMERRRDLDYYIKKYENKQQQRHEEEDKNLQKMGGGDAPTPIPGWFPQKTKDMMRSSVDASGCPTEYDFKQLEQDIKDARQILELQQDKIKQLKSILTTCQTKSGMPPLMNAAGEWQDHRPCTPKCTQTTSRRPNSPEDEDIIKCEHTPLEMTQAEFDAKFPPLDLDSEVFEVPRDSEDDDDEEEEKTGDEVEELKAQEVEGEYDDEILGEMDYYANEFAHDHRHLHEIESYIEELNEDEEEMEGDEEEEELEPYKPPTASMPQPTPPLPQPETPPSKTESLASSQPGPLSVSASDADKSVEPSSSQMSQEL